MRSLQAVTNARNVECRITRKVFYYGKVQGRRLAEQAEPRKRLFPACFPRSSMSIDRRARVSRLTDVARFYKRVHVLDITFSSEH